MELLRAFWQVRVADRVTGAVVATYRFKHLDEARQCRETYNMRTGYRTRIRRFKVPAAR